MLGETGTGKEVVARALHAMSGRSGAFVAVNCGALPASLLEAELFGHRRGAFTGAVGERTGLVRSAEGGTLFLDEIGELPPASQTAFLRVLQEREVVPIGDDRPVKVDVRLCAATHRDLAGLVERGAFRDDLFGRMFGVHARAAAAAPAPRRLRPLAARAARRGSPARAICGSRPPRCAPWCTHRWPLNIRALEKTLLTAATLATEGVIQPAHLVELLRRPPPPDELAGCRRPRPRRSTPRRAASRTRCCARSWSACSPCTAATSSRSVARSARGGPRSTAGRGGSASTSSGFAGSRRYQASAIVAPARPGATIGAIATWLSDGVGSRLIMMSDTTAVAAPANATPYPI